MAQVQESLEKQLKLEAESVTLGVKRYRDNKQKRETKGQASELPPGNQLVERLLIPLTTAIEAFVEKASNGKAGRRHVAVKYLETVDSAAAAVITLKMVVNSFDSSRHVLQSVAQKLGTAVAESVRYAQFAEQNPGFYRSVTQRLKSSTSARHRRAVMNRALGTAGIVSEEHSVTDMVLVGKALIDLLIESTGIVEIVRYTERSRNTPLYLRPTEETRKWLLEAHARCELLAPVFLPTVVPPAPWTGVYGGGYHTDQLGGRTWAVVKTRNKNYLEELTHVEMPMVYDAINAIQQTAWRINRTVLDVVREAWDSGAQLNGLPPRDDVPLPAKPHGFDENPDLFKAEHPDEWKTWKRRASEVHESNARLFGKRRGVVSKLFIAEKFAEEPAIYFPHDLDFRGRMYPRPAYLHPQGDDVARALLQFAEGKPLGDSGPYWLAVHGANLFGVDKIGLDDRVQWIEDNQDDILDSAFNPLDGRRFWTTADKPWQALAFCAEWAGFLMQGAEYESHLPVALDGSCNGLQHFSMLLRDEIGGAAVNLIPAEKPQDVYATVAAAVNDRLEHDAKTDTRAAAFAGKVTRKLVKRNVMTVPYGAKEFGMKAQLLEELRKLEETDGPMAPGEESWESARYLATRVYDAIGEVVVAARNAMDWLQEVAKLAAADGLPVHWTSPAGFPVWQAYRHWNTRRIDTYIGGQRVAMNIATGTGSLDRQRQRNGISPNFVHSLDAAHLMRTVVKCRDAGIEAFAMIHDSYGTHAADCGLLSYTLREAFVEQYERDVLGEFRDEIVSQLPPEMAAKVPPLPPRGTLDASAVRESLYFFA